MCVLADVMCMCVDVTYICVGITCVYFDSYVTCIDADVITTLYVLCVAGKLEAVHGSRAQERDRPSGEALQPWP